MQTGRRMISKCDTKKYSFENSDAKIKQINVSYQLTLPCFP